MTSTAHYFKVRRSVASLRFSLAPDELIAWPERELPQSLRDLERGGVIERLPGPPAVGFDVRVIAHREMAPEPPDRPEEQATLSVESLCQRFSWTRSQFGTARGSLGFPGPDVTRSIPAPGREVPDSKAFWCPSTVNRWEETARTLLATARTGWED